MNTAISILNVRNVEEHIRLLPTSLHSQAFVRDLMMSVATDCPLDYLAAMATVVIEKRKAELNEAGQTN